MVGATTAFPALSPNVPILQCSMAGPRRRSRCGTCRSCPTSMPVTCPSCPTGPCCWSMMSGECRDSQGTVPRVEGMAWPCCFPDPTGPPIFPHDATVPCPWPHPREALPALGWQRGSLRVTELSPCPVLQPPLRRGACGCLLPHGRCWLSLPLCPQRSRGAQLPLPAPGT